MNRSLPVLGGRRTGCCLSPRGIACLILLAALLPLPISAETIVPAGSADWSYLHVTDGSDPALADQDFNSTWFDPTVGGYDGPAFTAGAPAPFHYGAVNGLSGGTLLADPGAGIDRTSYFYKIIDGGAGFDRLRLLLLADDGAFVYLNGVLIARDGVTEPDTFTKTAELGDETSYDRIPLIGSPEIRPGPNLLAISVHQAATSSSDFGFDLKLIGNPPGPSIVRGPYLQSASAISMTVRWGTNLPGDTVVRYGDAPDNLTDSVTILESVTGHIATLTGLTPATRYYYQVESTTAEGAVSAGGDADHDFKTYPSPGARASAQVWVIGDSGTTSSGKQNVYNAYLSRAAGTRTDAWLMLGDNAYEDGTDDEFQDALFESYPELLRNTALWSCLGNHETVTGNGAPYLDLHTFPTAGECGGVPSGTERYYSFDHGNIHFISVDSETAGNYDDAPGTGGMIDWLEADLRATPADWIVAIMHHGPYTKGTVDSDTTSHLVEMRHYVVPLLEKYGVDLVLYGHSHVYERSMLINGHHSNGSSANSSSATFDSAIHVIDSGNGSTVGRITPGGGFANDGGDGAYQKPLAAGASGTVYVTCGTAGKISSWIGGSYETVNPTPHPVAAVSLRVLGSLVLDIDGNTLHARYIDSANQVRDDFSIVKGTTVELAATDDAFAEHGADVTSTFTLNRTGAVGIAEEIGYEISGSATNGIDFTPELSGSIAFAAGEIVKEITVTRSADARAEGSEILELALSAATASVAGGGGLRSLYFVAPADRGIATLLDAPSQQWWFDAFGPAALGSADWSIDGDDDGLTRLEEYAFGGLEGADNAELRPAAIVDSDAFALRYFRNPAATDLSYRVKRSTNLVDWGEASIVTTMAGAESPAAVQSWQAATSRDETRQFLRLELELAD